MEDLIKFFVFVSRLKFAPRRRWEVLKVKNADTVGDHIYMVTLLAWLFSYGRGYDVKKLLISSLSHSLDLAFPRTQDFYIKVLKSNPASLYTEVLDKKEINKVVREEKESLNQLLKYSSGFKEEIKQIWEDFRLVKSRESKFLNSIDKLENLLQAIVYKKSLKKKTLGLFWDECHRTCEDPKVLDFLESLKEFLDSGEKGVKNKANLNLIKFVTKISQIKAVKRRGWVIRGVKNPDSIASHSALSALMVWFLGKKKKLDPTVMFIMILLHDLPSVEIGDISPHDTLIERNGDPKKAIESFPWLGLRQEKEFIMRKTLERKSAAISKILKPLPNNLRRELKFLWLEFETGTSPEARFARQVDRIETVIQAMEFYIQDRSTSPTSFWLGLKELIDDAHLYKFVETIDNYYFNKQLLAKELVDRSKLM